MHRPRKSVDLEDNSAEVMETETQDDMPSGVDNAQGNIKGDVHEWRPEEVYCGQCECYRITRLMFGQVTKI